jgi:hypothetical protein
VADNDNTRDWAADCNGEGRERAVRDGRDSGVVMMAVVASDDDSEGRKQRMARACKIGRRPMKGTDKSGQQEMAETQRGNDGCGGGRWQRWTTTVVDDDNGDGNVGQRQRRWRMTTAANNDSGGQQQHARSGGGL